MELLLLQAGSSRMFKESRSMQCWLLKLMGAIVAGICNCNGHRNSASIRQTYHPRHEDQTTVSIDKLDLHTDCREVVLEIHNTERARFKESRKSQNNSN